MLVLQTSQLVYYMAILIAVAIVTGMLTGTVAKLLMYYLPKERKALFSQS